jgi:organic radical activating enzyme
MKINEHLAALTAKYTVLATVDLDHAHTLTYSKMQDWLETECAAISREKFQPSERVVFTLTQDSYVNRDQLGLLIRNLQVSTMEAGIDNFFVVVVSTNPGICRELELAQALCTDIHTITGLVASDSEWNPVILDRYPSSVKEIYKYGSVNPLKISFNDLSQKEQSLLTDSKVFCIYPWIHLNVNPDGAALPCCMTNHQQTVGNAKTHTLKEIWNGSKMKQIRLNMLNEQPVKGCNRCYEQEQSGFFSGRLSANKHHGHHIGRLLETKPDGEVERFEMVYWDIRYSNLCNLKCRSCGHVYSSQWYQDQVKLAGPDWKARNNVLNYAGRTETDMWEQLVPHLDHVEQIYFAGGEPLLMAEHYNILDELLKRGRTDVRLIYNTNFTHTDLKGRSVFEYWKQFRSVSVGASLDDSGARGEYIRKGTDWNVVEQNRRDMMAICPEVDFYVSATLSILNARNLPEFHRSWVKAGLIRPQDFNVNILQDPVHYRIDIAPAEYKAELNALYSNHIAWLQGKDPLNRATQGFESAITFMNSTDNTHLINKFWQKTNELDVIRNESILDTIPELAALK